ncbi:MAG: hypothetical protein EA401_05365 [Planctomycetota bacterium]|nr:MAG: hypothetical protein EA401_05365 [Planctomycetota bacterium]
MAEDDQAAPQAGEGNAKQSVLGPLVALLGVCIIGIVLVLAIITVLSGREDDPEDEDRSRQQQVGPLLDRALPMELGDVMVNVRGEEGRRYVKVTVEIWYPRSMRQQVERPEIRNRIVQAAEQRLATFDMQELNSEFIHETMSRAFQDQINKELRMVYGTTGTDTTYVEDVVLTNLLVQ